MHKRTFLSHSVNHLFLLKILAIDYKVKISLLSNQECKKYNTLIPGTLINVTSLKKLVVLSKTRFNEYENICIKWSAVFSDNIMKKNNILVD